jgi:carboxylesterase type B
MIWIQGGAFVEQFNPNYNGTGIVEASGGDVIVVTFNYRVGPYGFLASEELLEEGNLNIGIHDQRAAISWVKDHISQFGGDPDRVTLFGTSIGGGSVLLQTLAYGGNTTEADVADNARWNAGIAASVYIPSFYSVSDYQLQYGQLLNATNCTDLVCLRALGTEEIQAANIGRPPFPGQTDLPLFPYGPVIDGDLFTDQPLSMLKAGNISNQKPLIIGSSHTEGTIFATQANTTEDIQSFMLTQYPDLTTEDISKAINLYSSVPATYPGVTANESSLYYRLARMYGDAGFSCPALEFATTFSEASVPIYLFRDYILDPVEVATGYVVPHTWEVQAVWGPGYATNYAAVDGANSYDVNKDNHPMVDVVQKYWTGFAKSVGEEASGTPNWMRAKDSPFWLPFRGDGQGKRLRFQTNATGIETLTSHELELCEFWSRMSAKTHI